MYASITYQSIWNTTIINNDSATTKTLENSPVDKGMVHLKL